MGARTAVPVALALWLSLLAGGALVPAGPAAPLALAGASLVFAWLARRAPERTGLVALLLAVALAGGARGACHARRLEAERSGLGAHERVVRLVARVVEPPAREAGEPVAVVRVLAAERVVPRGARVRLRLPPGCAAEWGDRIAALVRLEAPAAARNPGGYDARAAADALALAATGRALHVRAEPGEGWHALPRMTATRLRRALEGVYALRLTPAARELAVPLVLGDRGGMSSEVGAELRASGLVHLLALSGLHVAWLAAVAAGACATLGGGVRARALASAACALLYAALAGPLASLARAAATELAMAGARLAGRALDPVQALALSAAALLAVAPGWAGDLGFQLSCAATLGLVTLAPPVGARAGRARALLATPIATLAAQLGATPLLLARFHALSWPGTLANLVAVPVAGLLLTAAWLAGVLDLAAPGSAGTLFAACELLARVLRATAERAAALPHAMLACGHEPAPVALVALGGAALATAAALPRTMRARAAASPPARNLAALAGLAAVGIGLALAASTRPLAPPAGRTWLVALDVGQGDALLIAHGGRWWLVDAGPRSPRWNAGDGAVLPFLRWAGVRRLEALVLTHDDGDHTGGAPAVRRALGAVPVVSPAGQPALVARFGARPAVRGDTLARAPQLRVLWPPDPADRAAWPAATAGTRDNAGGLVLELGTGRGRALLLADVDSVVEERLDVAAGPAAVKLAHHGSNSSSGVRFLARLGPGLAIVSAGRRNRYGHPHPDALARARRAGAGLARTDRDGAVWIELDDDGARRLDPRAPRRAGMRDRVAIRAVPAHAPARR